MGLLRFLSRSTGIGLRKLFVLALNEKHVHFSNSRACCRPVHCAAVSLNHPSADRQQSVSAGLNSNSQSWAALRYKSTAVL